MMHTLKKTRGTFLKAGLLGGPLLCAVVVGIIFLGNRQVAAAPLPVPASVADITDTCNGSGFFGLEPWYHFMPDELGTPSTGDTPAQPCGVRCFNILPLGTNNPNACGQTRSDIPGVLLAVVDDLLRIAGLVAVAFIIMGAFQFVGSRGNAEKTAQAQSTVISALTGLAIALVAVALVSFIGNTLQ